MHNPLFADRSRRGVLLRAAAVLGLTAMPDLSRARKGKRKCKKRTVPEPVPTCDEHCFPAYPLCFARTVGPPLCVNGAFTNGTVPCATDQDCLGDPSKPYCLVSETTRDTGSTSRFTTCEPYPDGCCISVLT